MTLSRRLGGFAAGLAAVPAAAQAPIDYRLPPSPLPGLRMAVRPGCPPSSAEDEIVVCGSREEETRYRVAPSPRAPGAAGRASGDQLAALAAGDSRCSTVGRNQQCNGGLDVLAIALTIVRAIAQARANRD